MISAAILQVITHFYSAIEKYAAPKRHHLSSDIKFLTISVVMISSLTDACHKFQKTIVEILKTPRRDSQAFLLYCSDYSQCAHVNSLYWHDDTPS